MKTLLQTLFLALFAPAVHSANISWTTSSIAGPADVSTAGIFVGAMNLGGNAAKMVNGVIFAADPGGSGVLTFGSGTTVQFNFSLTFDDFLGDTSIGGSAAYAEALDSARWNGASDSGTVTFGGLTVGKTYQVQFWIADSRGGTNTRVRTVKGDETGATPTTAGGPQLATGTFTTNASSQIINITGTGFGPQLNLFQLRDLGIVVTTLTDEDNGSLGGGTGVSLREAVKYSPSGSLITFVPSLSGQTLTLTHPDGDMEIPGALTIDATTLPGGLTVSGNNATRHFFVGSGKSLTLRGLTLTGGNGIGAGSNDGVGGAISNEGGTLTLTQCTLCGNSASNGGAIYSEGPVTLTQCTLTANSASYGGAIRNDGTLTLTRCTLSGNSASSDGGAIINEKPMTLTHTIVAGNRAPRGPDIFDLDSGNTREPISTSGVNLLSDLADSGLTAGPTVLVADPKLSPLGYFGGPVQTMHPLIGSPAIDAAGSTDPGGTDARGFPRFVDGTTNFGAQVNVRLDIGAVEAGPLRTVAFSSDAGSPSALRGRIGLSTEPGARLGFFAANFPAQSITLNGTQLDIPATANGLFIDASNLTGPVTISGNSTSPSRVFNIPSGATVAMHSVRIVGGNAGSGAGGGILNSGTCTVLSCTLSGNSTNGDGSGGGIQNSGTCSVVSSTLSGNSTNGDGSGGGILNSGTCSVVSSTLSGNSTNGDGGGIYNFGTCSVVSSTLSGNSATRGGSLGGGIFNYFLDSTFRLTSSIVAGNISPTTLLDVYGSLTPDSLNNLIGGNALLAPLANNGGPTQTRALQPGSPARNAGTASARSTDQRGFPIVGAPDLGAYEAQIGAIADVDMIENETPPTQTFPVGQIGVLTAASSNTTLVPVANIVITGSGASRSVTVTPAAGQRGICIITLTEDLHGEQQTFQFEVTEDTRFLVSNSNPSGTGSLQAAFSSAASTAGTNTIRFETGVTEINLEGELFLTSNDPEIIDAGTSGVTLVAASGNRHFQVPASRSLTLRGLTLQGGNAGGDGGSIYSEGTLILERCMLASNQSSFSGGAVESRGPLFRAVDCLFANNTATLEGGGIRSRGEMAELIRCTIMGSTGTGLVLRPVGINSALTLTQCTIAGNFSGPSSPTGGCLALGGNLALIHCTLSGNSGAGGTGGLSLFGSTTTLTHCIIAGNITTGGAPADIVLSEGTVTPGGANLIGSNQGVEAIFPAGPLVGTAARRLDPELAALANNGGPTQTMLPNLSSPALDQASTLSPALTTDQRGLPRPMGIRSDLGAVEGAILVTTPVDELDPVGVMGNGISLREAIRDVPENGTIGFDLAIFNTPATRVITLTHGPLNPQRNATLDARNIPGGVRVAQLPTFIAHPESAVGGFAGTASFAVRVVQLNGGVSYQWRKNGTAIVGQTNATFSINAAVGADEAFYDVVVEATPSPGSLSLLGVVLDPFKGTSESASLVTMRTVSFGIRARTPSAVLAIGESYTLRVLAAGPSDLSRIKYQWKKNGVNISGATDSSYTIKKASLAHAGTYKCEVRHGVEKFSATSEIVVIDTTPKTVTLKEGGRFLATVGAAGNILGYSWSNGQSAKSFSIDSVSAADAGVYTCLVNSHAGARTAGSITLRVISATPALATPLNLPPAYIGQNYFHQVAAENTAGAIATSFSLTGRLPRGIRFDKTTGILSGRPTVTKSAGYPLSFRVSNVSGSSAAVAATLQVIEVPATVVGSFAGPLGRSVLNGNLGGRFDLTVSKTGTFSGSVMFGALRRSFRSQLVLSAGAGDAILRGNIGGMTLADRTPVTAYVEFFAVEQVARLTLVGAEGTTLGGEGWRKTTPAEAKLVHFRLDPGTVAGAPQGYGFGSFRVSASNSLRFGGRLPDGSGLTGSGFVGPRGQVAVFQLLYGNRGSLVGQYRLTGDVLSGDLSWFKPVTTTGLVYREGFGPLGVSATGGVYVPPAAGQLVMAADSSIYFGRGGITDDFSQLVTIANPSVRGLTNTAVPNAPVTNGTRITRFDVRTGLMSGTFTEGKRVGAWNGQLVRIGGVTRGWGYFLLPTGVPNNASSPRLSGLVDLGGL